MAIELLQSVPFDELSGTLAHDYSGQNKNLTITNGNWIKGKVNNAIHLNDKLSRAEIIGTPVINFAQDFTYCFYYKADVVGGYPQNTWLLYKFAGLEDYLYLDAGTAGTNWTYIVIMQEGSKVNLFVDGELRATKEFNLGSGVPTGFCLLNDTANDSGGFCTIDELKVYSGINYDVITPPNTNMNINYFIGYHNFKDYGVRVKMGDGIFDALKMKEPFSVDWLDEHGQVLDLSEPRYEARTITLDCWIHNVSRETFETRIKAFFDLFYGKDTKRFHIDTGTTDYVYEIYLSSGAEVSKKWRDTDMVGEFKLSLIEPQPIKRLIQFIRADGNTTASITLSCTRPLSIYWGDGAFIDNVMGTNITITHTYSTNGSKFIIIAGVIEKITALTTNGILKNGANSYF